MEYLAKRIVHYQDILNLNNWQIRTYNCYDDKVDYAMATWFVNGGYTAVTLRAYKDYFGQYTGKNWQTINRMVIHELTHILVRDFSYQAHNRYANKEQLDDLEERLCDNVSVIIEQLEK